MNRSRLTTFSLATSLLALALFAPTAHGDNPDWTAYAKAFNISFPGYSGSTTLTDFPVLVRLSPQLNDFDYSKCIDGSDLRFSDAEGNLLSHEVDTWNPTGESLVWVKVTSFNKTTKITAHYGYKGDGQPPVVVPSDVWSADYVGVWHLNESGVPMAESSGVSTSFSTAGGSGIVYEAPGAIGGAVDFSSGNGSARLNAEEDDDLAGFMDLTIEVWTWQESAKSDIAYLLSRRRANAEASYTLYCNSGSNAGKMIFSVSVASGQPTVLLGSGYNILPVYGEWCHQAYVRNASGSATARAYRNGISVASVALNATEAESSIYDCDSSLYLGNSHGGAGQPFNGLVDELRISRVARSGDWLQASHDTVAKDDFAAYSAGRNDNWKSYSHKFSVSFENAFSDATTLQNFPVLIRVSTNGISGFLYTDCLQPDGGDLRFADEGGNLLQSEVDTWNTNGESLVWVKVPSFSSQTKLTAYYGCVLPGEVMPSEVWSQGYVGVWHLGESTLPLKESSGVSTSFSGVLGSGIVYAAAGAVGGAVDFSAGDSAARLSAADDDDLDGFTDCTFEVWTKQDPEPTRVSGIVTKRKSSSADFAYYIYNNYDPSNANKMGRNIFIVTTNGSTSSYALGSGNNMVPVWGEWCHQAFVRDASGTQKAYGYVNGTKKTGGAQAGAIHASAEPLYLGNSNGGSATFNGLIDELRISRVVRSQAWLQTSHDTVAKANFATIGKALPNGKCTILIFR